MPIPAYRAKQSTDTAGTGTLVLNNVASNARSFAQSFGASARRVMYAISWASGFEIGLGDFDGGTPGNVTRSTVLASSNGNALVSLPAGTKDVFAVFDPGAREILAISGTSTLDLTGLGNVVNFTGSSAATLNLPAVASVPIGAGYLIWNNGTATLTIDPSGAETVNGAGTLVLQAGTHVNVLRLGVGWMSSVPSLPSNGGTLTGQLLAPAESASAPSYSFSGDSDTGASNPGANQYAISSGGVIRLLVDASSYVGLNTLTPARQLEVASANNHMRFSTPGDATAYYDFGRDSTDGLFFFNGAQPTFVGYKWQINGTERFRIPATGAVTVSGGQTITGDLEASGNLRFNSGYGSAGIAYGVRAWASVTIAAGVPTMDANGNFTSITDNGVGDFTFNFSNNMPNTHYAIAGSAVGLTNTAGVQPGLAVNTANGQPLLKSTSQVRIGLYRLDANAYADAATFSIMVVR